MQEIHEKRIQRTSRTHEQKHEQRWEKKTIIIIKLAVSFVNFGRRSIFNLPGLMLANTRLSTDLYLDECVHVCRGGKPCFYVGCAIDPNCNETRKIRFCPFIWVCIQRAKEREERERSERERARRGLEWRNEWGQQSENTANVSRTIDLQGMGKYCKEMPGDVSSLIDSEINNENITTTTTKRRCQPLDVRKNEPKHTYKRKER